jgi:hypothetical protein
VRKHDYDCCKNKKHDYDIKSYLEFGTKHHNFWGEIYGTFWDQTLQSSVKIRNQNLYFEEMKIIHNNLKEATLYGFYKLVNF